MSGGRGDGAMIVYAVNQVYDETVQHGYEPMALFSSRERAEAYKARCDQHIAVTRRRYFDRIYTYEIEEWTVDVEESAR